MKILYFKKSYNRVLKFFNLFFRCFARPSSTDSVTIAGVTVAILLVLVAVAVVSSIFAFAKIKENKKLKEDILELENETNTNLIENQLDSPNRVPNEMHK